MIKGARYAAWLWVLTAVMPIVASAQEADCPAVLSEAPPLGEPAHSAQVVVNLRDSCPAIRKVTAVLYSDDEEIANRSFYDEAIANPPLIFPVAASVSLPGRAGLYRIEWSTEFIDGTSQQFLQTFAVPCPAPQAEAPRWSDADSAVLFTPLPGDACEGQITATLELTEISGSPVSLPSPVAYRADRPTPSDVSLPFDRLEGERRYTGYLLLRNEADLSSRLPIEFVTGCGPLEPTVAVIDGRMVGSVAASECQYPIEMKLSVVHQSGEELRSVEALLMDPTFDFALPEFDAWPAGDYTVETQFIGSSSRARASNEVSVACPAPRFSQPRLEVSDNGSEAEVVFQLLDRDVCQRETRVSLQVRDTNRVVVFNRNVDLPPSGSSQLLRRPFLGVPGTPYDLSLTAAYGLNHSESVDRSDRVVYECMAPEILNFGYSNPEASHLSALVALTSCNAPASAKLVVRNMSGRVVVDADPQIIQDVGTAYARLAPISLGHLDSGQYSAILTIADNKARTSTKELDLVRDVDGPTIGFAKANKALTGSDIPTLASLDELSLTFSDAHAPMPLFRPQVDDPAAAAAESTLTIKRIDGESTPQIWITGLVDFPRDGIDWSFIGLSVQGSLGERWLAPISRTFVPSEADALSNYHPSRSRMGFRAVARVEPLPTGRYSVLGLVVADPQGKKFLVPGAGRFNVSSLASQHHDALLRQGVSEIPIALSWSDDNTARLERVTSVPDGDYTLSAVGRDVFGNLSEVASVVLRLDQEKHEAHLQWPGIVGYSKVFEHDFRDSDAKGAGPIRVFSRRVNGYGSIRVNGQNITDQTAETLLQPNASGRFLINVELVDSDVDAEIVLHADSTEAKPLKIFVKTFKPEFVTQRTRTDSTDLLKIKYTDQPCRNVVFDDLSQVSLREDEVLCAVRINVPGTSVVATSAERSEVRLPPGVATDALYEEGFIRVVDEVPSFQPTRQVPIKDMQVYSATPQIQFEPLPQWRKRAAEGHFITSPGEVVAGHLKILPGPTKPVVYVNQQRIDIPDDAAGAIRLPLRTRTERLGESYTVSLRAHYPDTPEIQQERTYEFVAVPAAVHVQATDGEFVSPGPLSIVLSLSDDSGDLDPAKHGSYRLVSAELSASADPDRVIASPDAKFDGDGRIRANLPDLEPGDYRLMLTLESSDPRFSEHLTPIEAETAFEVLDGSPVVAGLFTFRNSDKTPFFGQLSVDYPNNVRRRDVNRVAWQKSEDGETFVPLSCCGHSIDFALTEPGVRHYRAELTNRHSGATSYTSPIKITAFLSGDLEVVGPRQTFRGYPATYRVNGLPEGYELLWRVMTPNASIAQEIRSPTLTISAEETGTYNVEVVADTTSDNPDSVSALRTYFTLESSWPRLPESVISGPTQVEFGKTYTFTVTHPPIFKDRGNKAVKRVGEWELPDKSRVKDDEWTQFTLRDMPDGFNSVDILYHTWIEGDQTTLTTAVHTIRPVSYRWPNWKLKVASNSVEPPAVLRLSVTPEEWHDWMDLGAAPVTTHWDLPDHVKVLFRSPTEAVVIAVDDRMIDVRARVTDPRGNITELEELGIRPLKQIPFEISLRAVAERSLHTAPIKITAHVDPIVLPKGRHISRVAFYVDGLYRGVTDGSPMELQIRTPGEHELRAIASIDSEFTSDDSVSLHLGENHQAKCTITPVGDFRLNGLAKAECDDPDGHMIEYRWYSNGQLLSDTGTRVQLSRADRLGISELSLVAVDNAGVETSARYVPPAKDAE